MAVMPSSQWADPRTPFAGRRSGTGMTPSQHITRLADAEQLGVRRITALLVDEFGGTYGSGLIEQYVSDFFEATIPTATITRFLPLLAERSVRERIRTRPSEAHVPAPPVAVDLARRHVTSAHPHSTSAIETCTR